MRAPSRPFPLPLLLVLAACATTHAPPAATPVPPAAAPSPAVPAAAAQPTLLEHVPAGARAAVVVRSSAFALLRKVALDDPALEADLSRHFVRTLGIDLP